MNSSPSRRWWVIGAVVAVLTVAVVIAVAASGGSDDSGNTSTAQQETAHVDVDEQASLPAFPGNGKSDPAVGKVAPTLVGEGFDGASVTIEPTGRPQVVMFLAHWCPHCQAEVPRIVELAKSGALDGLDVASVATGTNSGYPNYPPSAWLDREHWPFPVQLDDKRSTAAEAYGLSAYPFFVFLDAKGAVLGRATGEIDPGDLEKVFDAIRAGTALPFVGSPSSSSG